MTRDDDLDRQLLAWLDDPSTPPAPHYLGEVLERTRRTRQRPSWASLERWLPVTVITRPPTTAPRRLAWLLLVGLLVAALVGSIAIVGSRFLSSTVPDSPFRAAAPIPQGDEAIFAFATPPDGPDGGRVFTVRADGTDRRKLTDGPGVARDPSWSPDGTRIAYRTWQDGVDSVVVADAGGGSPITLAADAQTGPDCLNEDQVRWSPDGTSLLFATRDGCDGGFDLNIVPADGSAPPTRLLAPGLHSLFGSWSPDGTRIAYLGSEGDGAGGLYVADIGPQGALQGGIVGQRIGPDLSPNLAMLAADPPHGVAIAPEWSPDGTSLAAVVARNGFFVVAAEGVYIVEADGSGQRLVAERAGNPQWSPDGRRLAIQRTVDPSEYWDRRPCTVRTWIVDVDGGGERELPDLEDGCDFPALWSPDGTHLAVNLITDTPEDPTITWHLGFVQVDADSPPIVGLDSIGGSWQPVMAPLPPAPVFPTPEPS